MEELGGPWRRSLLGSFSKEDIGGNDMFDNDKNSLEKEVQFANVNSDIFDGDTSSFEKVNGQTFVSEIHDGEANGATCMLEKVDGETFMGKAEGASDGETVVEKAHGTEHKLV
ncbi:hypothetical protein LWI28_012347 [Acer negundo]|uniref:Uncharacterized protein n=1 Tax=Acer negundo TaxID=4023 RepID=A0AAD5NLM7_ACENE|nr:hypothetical protein LWI28_012347 [Acer negundo]